MSRIRRDNKSYFCCNICDNSNIEYELEDGSVILTNQNIQEFNKYLENNFDIQSCAILDSIETESIESLGNKTVESMKSIKSSKYYSYSKGQDQVIENRFESIENKYNI